MGVPRTALATASLAAIVIASACHRPGGSANDKRRTVAVDSLEGIVRVVGVEGFSQVALSLNDSSGTVTLDGPPSLRRVAGLRVAVVGAHAGKRFTVSRFTVVAANGLPAFDGVLALDGDLLVLVTATGRRLRLVDPSPVLGEKVGHRVWISGPLEKSAVAYGIIE